MEAVATETGFAPRLSELADAPSWLRDLRRAAFARFEELGFPTAKNEDWRSTGVQPIVATNWAPVRATPQLASAPPPGVRVRRLWDSLADAEPFFAKIAAFDRSAFTALNTASFDEAIVVEIERGAVVAEPIELAFRSNGAAVPEVLTPRVLVLAGERSQASIVETYAGQGRSFTNAVTEIALGEGARLEHSKLQRESETACHVHTIAVRQGRSSHFTSHNIALGGALARTDLHVTLDAEGAECLLNGLFIGRGTQHIDNHTVIDHAKPHCMSREVYKGIMDGSSRGVFHGKVIVRPDAQKTDAMQTNKNLLLSRHALVDSTPALEIFADDVKCKHGSTTGQLDPAALFYLRTRGIGEGAARALLTRAFAADVTDRIRIPSIRQAIEGELDLRLDATPGEGAR